VLIPRETHNRGRARAGEQLAKLAKIVWLVEPT
jgi:hypothetical protein